MIMKHTGLGIDIATSPPSPELSGPGYPRLLHSRMTATIITALMTRSCSMVGAPLWHRRRNFGGLGHCSSCLRQRDGHSTSRACWRRLWSDKDTTSDLSSIKRAVEEQCQLLIGVPYARFV